MVQLEETFAGRYVLDEVLGAGGSGLVRRARDTLLDRWVAIKLLRADHADEVERARLHVEATLTGRLHHAGIAQVYDYGEITIDEGPPRPYLVLQYVEGRSLRRILRERGPLPATEVMDLVAQLADALQAAHAMGIVHRDLKPSNVMVDREGHAVLVDFGIARSADAEPLTQTGTMVGTVDYLSPEQCSGASATARSDLYALGMLAYECLTGSKPFHRESPVATALAHLNEEVPPIDGVPVGVSGLLGELLAKDPDRRPASAAEVSARAFALAGGRPDTATGTTSATIVPPPPAPTRRREEQVAPWRRALTGSRRLQVAIAAAAVAVAVTVFVGARPAAPVTVPRVERLTWAEARADLDDRGLAAERNRVDRPGVVRGVVVGQTPARGEEVPVGTTVTLDVATGRVALAPGEMIGLAYQEAAGQLVALGLVPSRRAVPSSADADTVLAVRPSGRLRVGDLVVVTVAEGDDAAAGPRR